MQSAFPPRCVMSVRRQRLRQLKYSKKPNLMKTLLVLLILTSTWPAMAQNSDAPKERGQEPRKEPRGFGGPIKLTEDDKPAYPEPPAGWDVKRRRFRTGSWR